MSERPSAGNNALGSVFGVCGVYNLGTFTFDAATDISENDASTGNDDIFP